MRTNAVWSAAVVQLIFVMLCQSNGKALQFQCVRLNLTFDVCALLFTVHRYQPKLGVNLYLPLPTARGLLV